MVLPSEVNWGSMGSEDATAFFNDPDVINFAGWSPKTTFYLPKPTGGDDTAMIANVLASIAALGGTNAGLIVGDNYQTDNLVITQPITIIGSGRGGFYSGTTLGATVVLDVRSSDVHLRDFKVDGAKTGVAANQTMVQFKGVSGTNPLKNVSMRNVTINGSRKNGAIFQYVNNFVANDNTVSNCSYTGIGFLSCVNGMCNNNSIYNITQTGYSNSYGIYTSRLEVDMSANDPRSANICISGNRLNDIPYWDGINTHGGINHTISNNVITNVKKPIELVGSQRTNGDEVYAPLQMTVTGNTISGVSDGSLASGIVLVGADFGGIGNPAEYATGTITGNVVYGHGLESSNLTGGIQCYYTKGVSVTGNTLIECSPYGINFYNTNVNFTCVGNTMIDCWTNSGTVCGAINITSDYNTGYVAGNTLVRGTKTATNVNVRGITIANLSNNLIRMGTNLFAAATVPVNDTGFLGIIGDQWKYSSTAARPTAANAGAGAVYFDSTLGKPIWSTGTQWKDATGTVV